MVGVIKPPWPVPGGVPALMMENSRMGAVSVLEGVAWLGIKHFRVTCRIA